MIIMSNHKHHTKNIKRSCDYPECEHRSEHHCKYCHRIFCEEHYEAKLPGMPRFDSELPGDRIRMEEWRKPGGHACSTYYDNIEKIRKEENEQYKINLKTLIDMPKLSEKHKHQKEIWLEESPKRVEYEKKYNTLWGKPLQKEESKTPVEKIHKSNANIKKKILLISVSILIVIALILLFLSIQKMPDSTKIISENVTIQEEETSLIPLNIGQYMHSYNAPETISMVGYLKEEYIIGEFNTYVYKYISDDNNNKIRLNLGYAAGRKYESLFINNKTTTIAYNITGIIQHIKDSELSIEVIEIRVGERNNDFKIHNNTILVNNTLNITGKRNINLSYGIIKIRYFFGCNADERKYMLTCIPLINCSDGTLDPECSINKPYQCIKGQLIQNSTECGCPKDYGLYNNGCRNLLCTDGTKEPACSSTKPLQCINNTLISNSDKCGCPIDYKKYGNDCKKIQRCEDNTIYDECSEIKPLYCQEGELIEKASKCGCFEENIPEGDKCISKYMTDPKTITLNYILRGKSYQIEYTVYRGIYNHLSDIDRSIYYTSGTTPPSDKDFIMKKLNNEEEKQFIEPLVDLIRKKTTKTDDQARIAISLVQNIPYDQWGVDTRNLYGKYPYEVIYTNSGVCSEKSRLLQYLLIELGFGVATFEFDIENHEVVGIKCPQQYSYLNSGYCFVESTAPSIITDSNSEYVDSGKLTSTPDIIELYDGNSLDTVSEEYNDNREFEKIMAMGRVLPSKYYNRWEELIEKYGLE